VWGKVGTTYRVYGFIISSLLVFFLEMAFIFTSEFKISLFMAIFNYLIIRCVLLCIKLRENGNNKYGSQLELKHLIKLFPPPPPHRLLLLPSLFMSCGYGRFA
jgi:hypothetical protein